MGLLLIPGWGCLVVGAWVLIGWIFHLDALKTVVPGTVMMKFNTAVAFVLLGLAFLTAKRHRLASRLLATAVALLALAVSLQTVLGLSFGIDELFFRDNDSVVPGLLPGRMSLTAGICFMLNAAAVWILALSGKNEQNLLMVSWLSSLSVAVALFSGMASWSGATKGLIWEAWARTAVTTALLFVVVGITLLWMVWHQPSMRLRRVSGLTAGFIGGILLLSVIAATSDANNRERLEVVQQVERSYRLLNALNLLESDISEQERLLHVAVLQGDHVKLLQGYSEKIRARLLELQSTKSHVAHEENITGLTKGIERFEQIVARLKPVVVTQPLSRPEVARTINEADTVARDIHTNAVGLRKFEHNLLSNYATVSEASAKRTLFFVPASTLVSLLLLSSAFFLLHNEIRERQRALEDLRWSEERFRTMADSIPQLAWIADNTGRNLWYNRRWSEYTGLSEAVLLRLGWYSVVDPERLPALKEKWERSLESGSAFQEEALLRNHQGHFRQFLVLALPLKDHTGRVLQWFGTSTDMEDYTRAMTELRRKEFELRLSQQLGHTGTFVWDVDKDRAQWSPELEALYGLEPGSFTGLYEDWLKLIHPEDRQRIDQLSRESLGTREFVAEWRVIWPDGSIHWLGGRASLSCEADKRTIIGAHFETTEIKQAEAEVRKLNLELEERVLKRTQQLQEANQELEAFSYSVSHDLRAPLRALDGFSRVLLEEHAVGLDAEGQRMLGILRTESQRMGQLIDDLLTFARLGRQSISPVLVDMDALAHSALQEILSRFVGRQIEVEIAPLPPTYGEQSMLRQVWVNLLDNAAKFTQNRVPGQISLGCEKTDEETIYWVKDNGVGFDMRFAAKLFGVFQRLHSDQEFGGTGVGLALVKRIVHRHGGRVWAKSEPGQGASFYFSLPNNSPPEALPRESEV